MAKDKAAGKKPSSTTVFDKVKWLMIIAVIIAAIWANNHYMQISAPLRLAAWILLACLLLAATLTTRLGKACWQFGKEARGELRKVAWPTRQETVQTTLLIIGMVVLMAVILWGIDSLLLWSVGHLTGQRG